MHDTLGTKLDMCARDGHWVGFDPESDGHRIYFPDRGVIGVEQSVSFEQRERDIPVMPLTASMQGEQKIVSAKNHMDNQHVSPPDQTNNAPAVIAPASVNTDHLGPNFETPDPQQPPRCSTCQRFESEYFK